MKKYLVLFLLLTTSVAVLSQSFYDFTVKDIDGNDFSFGQLKGKKVMVVNVASKCGFTPQYKELEALYKRYRDKNFVIVGFPANNFKEQEPGSNAEIKAFCTLEYGVSFPMMAKVSVKGDDMAPIYQWLTTKELNGKSNSSVKWNFQKYLVNEKGELEQVINPWVEPDNKKIVKWIEK
ncbi:MAG: glutathione peroxidase [Bacteroidales bacterium]|nr:glutathione peroxidase [Bacteroidales bacterium]MCF6341992.1 glutathione peroxidase [Bacteroidales bacterium]